MGGISHVAVAKLYTQNILYTKKNTSCSVKNKTPEHAFLTEH
jgi:hypothetical protein